MDKRNLRKLLVLSAPGTTQGEELHRASRRFIWQAALIALLLATFVAIPTALAAPLGDSYVVQHQDTLADIAWSMGVSTWELAQANGIDDADMIYVGQVLSLPGYYGHESSADSTDWSDSTYYDGGDYSDNRWIEIDLSWQTLTAYEGDSAVFSSLVSTGVAGMETPTGEFTIDYKLPSQTMYGADYYLPNVPYVMYFYGADAIHGTYWHSNFGTPMSHGCVNLPTDAAGWLYGWASAGTLIWIHY